MPTVVAENEPVVRLGKQQVNCRFTSGNTVAGVVATMLDQVNSAPRPALLKQAEIPPVQRDGVFPFAVGTALAAVISVVLYLLGCLLYTSDAADE